MGNKLQNIIIDDYALFLWRGENSKNYGVFIINEGEDLQWHPYRNFSNEYSQPLYKNIRNLLGVTFESKVIELKLGAYNITAEDFRKITSWLDPLVIDKLSFNYDKDWYYNVKISNFSTVTKYIIGEENNNKLYYAEFNISFETQDEGYAYYTEPQSFTKQPQEGNLTGPIYLLSNTVVSEENVGIFGKLDLQTDDSSTHYITLEACYETDNNEEETITLFNLNFKQKNFSISLIYNSEKRSLLFNDKLISTTTVDMYGNTVIEGYNVYCFLMPGKMKNDNFDYNKFKLKLFLKGFNTNKTDCSFYYLPKKLLI